MRWQAVPFLLRAILASLLVCTQAVTFAHAAEYGDTPHTHFAHADHDASHDHHSHDCHDAPLEHDGASIECDLQVFGTEDLVLPTPAPHIALPLAPARVVTSACVTSAPTLWPPESAPPPRGPPILLS